MDGSKDEKLNKIIKYLLIFALLSLGIYIFFDKAWPIVFKGIKGILAVALPFLLALLFTIILEPAIDFLERKTKLKRGAATIIIAILIFLLVFGAFGGLITKVIMEVIEMFQNLPSLEYIIQKTFVFLTGLAESLNISTEDLMAVKDWLLMKASGAGDWFVSAFEGVSSAFSTIPTLLVGALVTIVVTYYFCKNKNMAVRGLQRYLPERHKNKVTIIWNSASNAFAGYIRSTLTLMLIAVVIATVGMLILGVKYGVALGLLTGLVDIMPVLGPATVLIPVAIWQIVIGNTGVGIGVVIVYAIMTLIRNIIEPKLLATNIGLHPVVTLAALFIGFKLFGVIGMISFPILAVVFKSIYSAIQEEKMKCEI